MAKRKARTETMWMAANPHPSGGFAPWGWGFGRKGAASRMETSKDNWGGDFVVVKVKITEIKPAKRKAKK